MIGSKTHCWLSVKCTTPNFVVVDNVLMPICCHSGVGMSYLLIFVEETVALLDAMTDKWV